jgi:hypothetical protein
VPSGTAAAHRPGVTVEQNGEGRVDVIDPPGRVLRAGLAAGNCGAVRSYQASRSASRRARGNVVLTRFADDFIVGFQHQDDAEKFLGELRGRLAKFSLEQDPADRVRPRAAGTGRRGARGSRRRSRSWDSGTSPG